MSTIEEHRYYRTNLENTALRKENNQLKDEVAVLRDRLLMIATICQDEYSRKIALKALQNKE